MTPKPRPQPMLTEAEIVEIVRYFPNLQEAYVREQIALALTHEAALKYHPPNLYVRGWVRRQARWDRLTVPRAGSLGTDNRGGFSAAEEQERIRQWERATGQESATTRAARKAKEEG